MLNVIVFPTAVRIYKNRDACGLLETAPAQHRMFACCGPSGMGGGRLSGGGGEGGAKKGGFLGVFGGVQKGGFLGGLGGVQKRGYFWRVLGGRAGRSRGVRSPTTYPPPPSGGVGSSLNDVVGDQQIFFYKIFFSEK